MVESKVPDEKIWKAYKTLESFLKEKKQGLDSLSKIKNILENKSVDSKSSKLQFPLPDDVVHSKNKVFALFSDGACRGNPGPGSWGAMAQDITGQIIFESSGVEMKTTNNRMELVAALNAIENIEEYLSNNTKDVEIWLYSDSKYVVNGLEEWVAGWKKRGWKKADKKAPENLDLWKLLDDRRCFWGQYLKLRWVKGHSGHPQNEYCDYLANQALDDTLGI